jgi:hypothetical protein
MKNYILIALLVFLGVYGLSNATISNPSPVTNAVITTGTINYATSSTIIAFTNNTSKNFMVTSVSAETLTVNNVTLEPQATLQANGGSWDLVDGSGLTTAIASGVVNQIKNVDVAAGVTFNVLPGDSMTLNVVSGTADAYTGRIIISGIYY